jgi:Kef-type K+ transport system membrane component KefB
MWYIGIVILAGIIGGKFSEIFHAPVVTGYLLFGILIGPQALGLVDLNIVNNMHIINEIALALIAFSIGAEFNFNHIKKLGKNIFIITLMQAFVTLALVFIVSFYVFDSSFSFSILLAAISCATAPAATLMVINQYNADGPLVRTILPVVAIDDAVCIITFGIAMALSKTSLGNQSMSFVHMLREPIIEIATSLSIGFILGFVFSVSRRYFKNDDDTLIWVLGVVFIAAGISLSFDLSPLLTCMTVGATITNFLPDCKKIFYLAEKFSPPLYLIFFTVAGASLHLTELTHIGLFGLAYLISRTGGKIFGAALGAKMTSSSDNIVKYLGFGLLPQAGVAIGLVTLVNATFPEFGSELRTIVLGGVVFFEVIGPFSTKFALRKAGEINQRKSAY